LRVIHKNPEGRPGLKKRRRKMKNLKSIIAENTEEKEGVASTNWDQVEAKVNEHINAIVVKTAQKEAEKAVKDVFETIGIDGVTDSESLQKHIKTISKSTDEIRKELEEKDQRLQEYETKSETLNQQLTEQEREKALLELGITDPDSRDYVLYNVGKRVNEETTWEAALQAYQEEKPQYFKPTIATTGARVAQPPQTEKTGWEKILAEKHPDIFKNQTKE